MKIRPYITALALFFLPYMNFAQAPAAAEEFRTNLYAYNPDGTISKQDGCMVFYDSTFSNNLDVLDLRKMMNFAENIGMSRGSKLLSVERRSLITFADTIFFAISQMRQKNYQLEFITVHLDPPGMTGLLVDSYSGSTTPVALDGTTYVDISVNADPRSSLANRFKIVFSPLTTLPVTFISVKATPKNENVVVSWTVGWEDGIKKYEVQRSADGINFSNVMVVVLGPAHADKTYTWLDQAVMPGFNYYRIHAVEVAGNNKMSSTVLVRKNEPTPVIRIFTNPASHQVDVSIDHLQKGEYQFLLQNDIGQQVFKKMVAHTGGSLHEAIVLKNYLITGLYYLNIKTRDKNFVRSIFIE